MSPPLEITVAAIVGGTVGSAIDLLRRAAQRIPPHYLQLPVAGTGDAVYRERVYSYELYHQLRTLMDDDDSFQGLMLCGEVDKQGHPLLRPYKPDLLLHVPGEMGKNLLVVEIKPGNAKTRAIRKDLVSLGYFLSEGIYQVGVYLVYGGEERHLERFRRQLQRGGKHLRRLHLLWHREPAQQPEEQNWRETE